MAKNKMLYNVIEWLLIVGGLNWGLALVGFNLVSWLAGVTISVLEPVVYVGIGASAVYLGYVKMKKR